MADKGQPLFCRIDNAGLTALSLDGQQKALGLLLCHRPESLAVSKLQHTLAPLGDPEEGAARCLCWDCCLPSVVSSLGANATEADTGRCLVMCEQMNE